MRYAPTVTGATKSRWGPGAALVSAALLLLGAGAAPEAEPEPIPWKAACEPKTPCRVTIAGEQVLVTGRGELRCAEKGQTLGCLFSSRDGRSHEAWFVGLADRSVHPIRVDPGHALLAEPVWDPDGLRLMLRRPDGSLTTRTLVPPQVQPRRAGAQGWAAQLGDAESEPGPVRLALGPGGWLITGAGQRFRSADGEPAAAVPALAGLKAGIGLGALEVLAGGDLLLAGELAPGSEGLAGAPPPRVVGGERGGRDLFLARLSPEGSLRWLRTWGSAGDDRLRSLQREEGEVFLLAGRYEGLVDLDPGEGTSLANAAPDETLTSRFDGEGRLLPAPSPEAGPDPAAGEGPAACPMGEVLPGQVLPGQVPADCQATCVLRAGEGPMPRTTRRADLRVDGDASSHWLGCFHGERAHWLIVLPVGIVLEDAAREGDRLCLGGQAKGGPHDLAAAPTQSLWVGDPELESVAFVACLPLSATLAP
ncbi:MAG: hypothetical protein P1V51_04820 [Deltaproteobacteria bacterium]|nr:hypothetical protein [Deltaproteobacteria bacterium]